MLQFNKTIENCDDITIESARKYNPNWMPIPDHSYRILITGACGSGKINELLNLISQQRDIDKIYLCAKDLYEAKYQLLINKHEDVGLKHCNDTKGYTHMIWMSFLKILNNPIQIKNAKYV